MAVWLILPPLSEGTPGGGVETMRTRRAAMATTAATALAVLVTGCAGVSARRKAVAERVQLDVPFYSDSVDRGGRAALASLLTFWDQPIEPEQLKSEVSRQAGLGPRGSLPTDLVLAAENRGMQARSFQGTLEEVKVELKLGHPVLAFLDLDRYPWTRDRFVLVTGFDDARGGFFVHSERQANRYVPYETFMSRWNKTGRWAILVMPAGEATMSDRSARYP